MSNIIQKIIVTVAQVAVIPYALSTKKEYLNLIPLLSEVEFDLLKQAIKEEGMHVSIIVNKRGLFSTGIIDSEFLCHQGFQRSLRREAVSNRS